MDSVGKAFPQPEPIPQNHPTPTASFEDDVALSDASFAADKDSPKRKDRRAHPYICDVDGCGKVYQARKRPYPALMMCRRAFGISQGSGLSQATAHNVNNGKAYICENCQRSFTAPQGLEYHRKKKVCHRKEQRKQEIKEIEDKAGPKGKRGGRRKRVTTRPIDADEDGTIQPRPETMLSNNVLMMQSHVPMGYGMAPMGHTPPDQPPMPGALPPEYYSQDMNYHTQVPIISTSTCHKHRHSMSMDIHTHSKPPRIHLSMATRYHLQCRLMAITLSGKGEERREPEIFVHVDMVPHSGLQPPIALSSDGLHPQDSSLQPQTSSIPAEAMPLDAGTADAGDNDAPLPLPSGLHPATSLGGSTGVGMPPEAPTHAVGVPTTAVLASQSNPAHHSAAPAPMSLPPASMVEADRRGAEELAPAAVSMSSSTTAAASMGTSLPMGGPIPVGLGGTASSSAKRSRRQRRSKSEQNVNRHGPYEFMPPLRFVADYNESLHQCESEWEQARNEMTSFDHIYGGWQANNKLYVAVSIEETVAMAEAARAMHITMYASEVVSLNPHQCVVADDATHPPALAINMAANCHCAAWIPNDDADADSQILAVVCTLKGEDAEIPAVETAMGQSFLQLWRVNLKGQQKGANLEACMIIDSLVLDLKFHPNPGAAAQDPGSCARIGLLACALSNGRVVVFSIPNTSELVQHVNTNTLWDRISVYRMFPVMELVASTYPPLSIDWVADRLVAACHDGYVGLWTFNPQTPVSTDPAVTVRQDPTALKQVTSASCTCVSIHPLKPNLVVTSGTECRVRLALHKLMILPPHQRCISYVLVNDNYTQVWDTSTGPFIMKWEYDTSPQPFKWWKLTAGWHFHRETPIIGGSERVIRMCHNNKIGSPVLKTLGESHTLSVSQPWGVLVAAGLHNAIQFVKLPKGDTPLPDPRSYMSAASELCFVYGTNMDGTQLADDSDHAVFRLFLMKEDKYPLQVVPSDVQRVAEVTMCPNLGASSYCAVAMAQGALFIVDSKRVVESLLTSLNNQPPSNAKKASRTKNKGVVLQAPSAPSYPYRGLAPMHGSAAPPPAMMVSREMKYGASPMASYSYAHGYGLAHPNMHLGPPGTMVYDQPITSAHAVPHQPVPMATAAAAAAAAAAVAARSQPSSSA
ncbi:uncharacterized protein MONBRDRAFT_23852 [Monosiga brevicollis MX1]|uniref:C2H2-type domain-containing protein n=1 Tax=Monosiga brevicollis TaxID=81824 RepID=A9UV10_MONBE|nr:uncharacterized protein MONBRDRAFT_23852 [Monosiga brevicollis MX1]EDQ90808.1 predicted protein [Monosiga brevicollis MX1]|eukprot:XP_001744105.1 hypothetical protein [Monosiga brevicollis MX1]